MSSPDSVESRLAALERGVAQLREQTALAASDAAAARTLAAGAARDVSEARAELRSHTRVLTALRETQVEHGQVLAELRQDVGELRQGLDGQARTTSAGFATVHAGMEKIVALLTAPDTG